MAVHTTRVFRAAILLLASAVACGNDNGEGPAATDPSLSPGTAVTIRGTERLFWDQTAASYPALLQYSFALYVDGSRVMLAGVECIDSAGSSGYPCSAALPQMANGIHILSLAAIADGLESGRSSPVTVDVSQGRLVIEATKAADRSSLTRRASLCVAQAACFAITRHVTSGVPLSSPAPTPDGRLFFVEDGRHVRVLDRGVLLDPAFSLAHERARLVAILVDPAFDRTRFVRLAWIEETREGPSLVIARLRESNNRLGEPVVIVPPMVLAAGRDPRVTQDDQGRIYVAMPGDGTATRSGGDLYAAALVRFGSNGLTWSEGLGGPVVARGYERPRALTFDRRTQQLWLAGVDRDRGDSLISIGVADRPADRSGVFVRNIVPPSSEAIVSLAPIGNGPVPDFLALDASGTLLSASAEASALRMHGRVPFESGEPLSIDAGVRGEVFVTARSTADFVPSYGIFLLEPQPGR
jgi:hypothetical protein